MSVTWTSAAGLAVTVTNRMSTPLQATLTVRTVGVGNTQVTVPLASVQVAGSSSTTFSLLPAHLPVRSLTIPSRTTVALDYSTGAFARHFETPARAWLATSLATDDIAVDVDPYLRVVGLQGMVTAAAATGATAPADQAFDAVVTGTMHATGVLRGPTGDTPLSNVTGTLAFTGLEQSYLTARLARQAAVLPAASAGPTPQGGGGGGCTHGCMPMASVCTTWEATFADSGYGESFLAASGTQFVPAAFTSVTVSDWTTGTTLATGFTTSSGCISYPSSGTAGHQLVLYQRSNFSDVPDGATVKVVDQPSTSNLLVLGTFFTPASGTGVNFLNPGFETELTRVAAVVGQILTVNVGTGYLTPYEYDVYAADPIADAYTATPTFGPTGALLIPAATHLGPNLSGPDNSAYKFVVAHEFGHQVQDYLFGTQGPVLYDPQDGGEPAGVPAVCTCDTVVDPTERGHCLDSRMNDGTAQLEAFSHYFSTRTFNPLTQTSPTFVYYKRGYGDTGQIQVPPYPVNAGLQTRWTLNRCPPAAGDTNGGLGYGTEHDWLEFFWKESTQSSGALGASDYESIYRGICGGRCDRTVNTSYATIRSEVASLYGGSSTTSQNVSIYAAAYGVAQ